MITSTKKKRVSKKKKESWRKFVNMQDVDDFLEDQRLEERLGKPFDERLDEELFEIDLGPTVQTALTRKEKRQQVNLCPPKCFRMLQSHTNVLDPISKRNRVRTAEERRHPIAKQIDEQRRQKGLIKFRDRANAETREREGRKKLANQYVRGTFNKDVWIVEDTSNNTILNDTWCTNDTIRHTLSNTGKLRKIVPISIQKKTSILPQVEPPHPGLSYNPSLQDHRLLLTAVAEKEAILMKQEQHLHRVTTNMFSKTTADKKEKAWLKEMIQGLPIGPEKKESEDTGEYKAVNPPVINKKKDRKQKRKQKEQQQLRALQKLKNVEKKKSVDIHKLQSLTKHLESQDNKQMLLRQKRLKREKLKQLEPKRLSARKFEASDIEFSTGDHLSGNLRNFVSKANLLNDRFKSLQKRNILEPSAISVRKRAKIKRFVRPGHKMSWED